MQVGIVGLSKLTPSTTVASGSFIGAETTTFRAPACEVLRRVLLAPELARALEHASTPSSPHGSRIGSGSCKDGQLASVDGEHVGGALDSASKRP